MYSKKVSFTTAQLNTNQVTSGIIPITMNPSGIVGGPATYKMYPRNMRFVNGTGQTVSFGLINDDAQYIEYQATPSNFALIPVANNTTWTPDILQPLPRSKYFMVQGSGTVSTGLDVYFMNFA